MKDRSVLGNVTYARVDDFLRIATSAVAKAQDDSRQQGVPNVYSINGQIYFELSTGELSADAPYPSSSFT